MRIAGKRMGAIVLAAAMIFGAVYAQAAGPGPRYEARAYGQQLTPEQMGDAERIFNEGFAGMENTRQELAAKRAELDQQLASPNPDRGRIEALSREIGDLRGKMLSARVGVRERLAERGLPPDYYGYGPRPDRYYGPGYGPCWDDGPRYRGHHGSRHGSRGGCWGTMGPCWR